MGGTCQRLGKTHDFFPEKCPLDMWCYCHYSASALVPGSIWAHAYYVRGTTLVNQHD